MERGKNPPMRATRTLVLSGLLLAISPLAVGQSKASDASTERTTNMKIRIKVGDKSIVAALASNETARDFVSVLPLNVSMSDLFGREKYGDFHKGLSAIGPRTSRYEIG